MQTAGRLEVTTPSDLEIAMSREFDAPRELLWDAYTNPALVSRWLLGPDGWTFRQCDMDVRVGGTYRWVWWKEKTQTAMGTGGTYREVQRPDRLVHTEKFDEPWASGGGESVVTVTFTERNGKTTMLMTQRFESREVRDAVLKTGMETGVERSYQRLDEMLPELLQAKR